MPDRICSVTGCDRQTLARGWCRTHYERWRTTGDVNAQRPIRAIISDHTERFWSKVDKTEDCWIWTGTHSHDGYGVFPIDGTNIYAHRYAWELIVGPIDDGLTLDHLCRTRNCVRAPDHLSAVTIQENMSRGMGPAAINSRKTHCKRGHPFDDANTWIGKNGERKCRACGRDAKQRARGRR